jgi:hypothetical protein
MGSLSVAAGPSRSASTASRIPRSGSAGVSTGTSQQAALTAMYQSAQLKLAYVMLCLRNSVRALAAGRAVLSMPVGDHSEQRRHLAHLYCAEALCRLNRASDAQTELDPSQLRDRRSVSFPGHRAALNPPPPRTLARAHHRHPPAHNATLATRTQPITTAERAALFVNLANVHALQKDFVRAKKVAGRALALCPALPAAVRVLVYIELHEGNNARALQLLQKRHDSPAKPRTR